MPSTTPDPRLACSCSGPPEPEQDQGCPVHGDVRWYSAWLVERDESLALAEAEVNQLQGALSDLVKAVQPFLALKDHKQRWIDSTKGMMSNGHY